MSAPRPASSDTAAFWNRAAPKYAGRKIRDPAAYAATLDRVRAYLSAADRVLEVGCGTGTTAVALAEAAGRITATDIAPGMIQIARARIAEAGAQNVTATPGAPGDGTLPQGPYDAVMAFNLLHLVADLDAVLANVAQLTRPGGHFLSKTPCLQGAVWLRPVIAVARLAGKAPAIAYLDRAGLQAAIRRAGFEIVETGDYPQRPPSHFVAARRK